MRGSERRQRLISVPADAAWAVVGRPELLHHWFPGIDACTVDGRTRTITTGMGLQLAEELVTNDPLQRRFQYRVDGGLLREHLATIDVHDLGAGRCLVSYATDAAPAAMALTLGGATQGALEELRRQLEAGAGPAIDARDARDAGTATAPAQEG